MNPALPTAVAYVRVSTDEQANGLDAQRSVIEAWAARTGRTIAAWHADKGVSGAAPLEKRPGLTDAIVALREAGSGAVLVVAKRDRLARDVVIAATVERICLGFGATVESADGAGHGDGPEAALMRAMLDAFAQYERALIRFRTSAALAVKRRRGEAVGHAPFGSTTEASGRLVEDAREAEVVAVVLELHSAGMSMRDIVEELNAKGFVSRRLVQANRVIGGTPIQLTQVARIIKRAEATP